MLPAAVYLQYIFYFCKFDEQKLESAIKNTIIKLAQKETSGMKSEKNLYTFASFCFQMR